MAYPISDDWFIKLARGRVPGHRQINGLGERESMSTTSTGEEIWRGNELSPAPTSHTLIPTPNPAGEQMSIVSENTNDTAAGTGIRTIMIHCISAEGEERAEIITLNGTTPVPLSSSDLIFVNDFHAVTVGTGGVAAGHIKIHNTASVGLVYSMIAAGGNRALVPRRMVPKGHTMVVTSWQVSEAQAKRVNVRLRSTNIHDTLVPGVFLFKDTTYLKQTATGYLYCLFTVPEFGIVTITGWADTAGAEVGCSWTGMLISDNVS